MIGTHGPKALANQVTLPFIGFGGPGGGRFLFFCPFIVGISIAKLAASIRVGPHRNTGSPLAVVCVRDESGMSATDFLWAGLWGGFWQGQAATVCTVKRTVALYATSWQRPLVARWFYAKLLIQGWGRIQLVKNAALSRQRSRVEYRVPAIFPKTS